MFSKAVKEISMFSLTAVVTSTVVSSLAGRLISRLGFGVGATFGSIGAIVSLATFFLIKYLDEQLSKPGPALPHEGVIELPAIRRLTLPHEGVIAFSAVMLVLGGTLGCASIGISLTKMQILSLSVNSTAGTFFGCYLGFAVIGP